MVALEALPTLDEALWETWTDLRHLLPPWHGMAGKRPAPGRGEWLLPSDMGRDLAVRGRVRCAEDGAWLVVYRDQVVAIAEHGKNAWVCSLLEASEVDLDAAAEDIVRRAGEDWLDPSTVRLRRASGQDDPDGEILVRRLEDLLVAVEPGEGVLIHVERGRFDGDEGHVGVLHAQALGWRAFVEGATAHAVRCASHEPSSGRTWWLNPNRPHPHLSSSWFRVVRRHEVRTPDAPASAGLRAAWRRAAAARTLDWLAATAAPRRIVEQARSLQLSGSVTASATEGG